MPHVSIPKIDKFIKASEAAAHLQLPPRTVQRMFKSGKLRGFKMGTNWVIFESELTRFLANRLRDARRMAS